MTEIRTSAELTVQPIADVQAQIGRVDTKASILAGLALGALTGGTAVASKAHLTGAALVVAVLAAVLAAVALVLLGAAIRPVLGGNDHGFMRWANMLTAAELSADLTASGSSDTDDSAAHLWLLARTARSKYRKVRRAVDLLAAALFTTALTAVLHALGV